MSCACPSFLLHGIDAHPCEVEARCSEHGLPQVTLVGLPDAAVRESMERVRSAVASIGASIPRHHVVVNLAPADRRKEGGVYDLPIALALLAAGGAFAEGPPHAARMSEWLVAGELALDGRLRPIRGACPMAVLAAATGKRGVVLPAECAAEAALVGGIEARAARHLSEVVAFFQGRGELDQALPPPLPPGSVEQVDFGEIRAQEAAKRALCVSAAGGHNALLVGPPGCGKTMMARALAGILPPLAPAEALEVMRVRSAAGLGSCAAIERPVRCPHHATSVAALIGGGMPIRPGEVTLAHRGILFLDELPEFPRNALEALREVLEDRAVTIARSHGTVRMPARFMLVAAMNPTAHGGSGGAPVDAASYLARLSRPLVDRIDIHVEVPAVPLRELSRRAPGASTADLAQLVRAARERQRERQGSRLNAAMPAREMEARFAFDAGAREFLAESLPALGLSARGFDKVRRVSRSVADIDGSAEVRAEHVAEAVQYRALDRTLAACGR